MWVSDVISARQPVGICYWDLVLLVNIHVVSSLTGISSLLICRVRASAVEVYKCINGINPAFIMFMYNHFTERDSQYNFRELNAVSLPNFTSITYEEKLLDTHVWNNAPSHIKCAPTLNSFKDLIRS